MSVSSVDNLRKGENTIEEEDSRPYGIISRLIKVDRFHRIAIDSQIRKIGVHRSQHRVIMYLSKCGHAPTQEEIAKKFEITPAAVAVTLKKLEAAGLVERVPQSGNCRANEVRITSEGNEIVSITDGFFKAADRALVEDFTDEELTLLENFLDRMVKNLKNYSPELEDLQGPPESFKQENRKAKDLE